MSEEWKNARAEAEMRAAGEKIMKEAKDRDEKKKKNLSMSTRVKYLFGDVSGDGEIVGVASELSDKEIFYIVKTDNIISDVYPYTTFICPAKNIKVA